jgi:predicted RNA polymerase sigma factor
MAGSSFEKLFREQSPSLVAVGVAVLGTADVARDLAQETMARAHANWETVAGADVPEAWPRAAPAEHSSSVTPVTSSNSRGSNRTTELPGLCSAAHRRQS